MGDVATPMEPEWAPALIDWRQGDYFLLPRAFVLVSDLRGADAFALSADNTIEGLAVITQTCDVVNWQSKDTVVVCPLVEARNMGDVVAGRTPAAAVLEQPPAGGVVADLSRMMTVHKSILAKVERREGFATDDGRARFARALERKHGRFAFPDSFSKHVLGPLRDLVRSKHDRNSDFGRAYRSLMTIRASADGEWESGSDLSVTFWLVVHPQDERETKDRGVIAAQFREHLDRLTWPRGYALDPEEGVCVRTLDEMTAREWVGSHSVDWDYLSGSSGSTAT